jgi:hypothetical protein
MNSPDVPTFAEAKAFLKALTLPTQDAIDRWIASGPPLEDAGVLRSVQDYAQFFLAYDGMVKAFSYVKNELDASLDMLKRRAIEDAERLRQGAIRPPPPSVVVETPPSSRGRQNEISVRLDLKDRDRTPVRLNEWDIKQTFEYADQSCTYDSLFASMFAIPNQWLRNQILKKEIVNRFPWCEENAVKAIDNTVVATIAYFERRLARVRFDAVCPNRNIWKECLPKGTAPGVQEEGNPLLLLDSLIRFYELQDAWLMYTQTYNDPNWNPQAGPSVIPDAVELYAVTAESTAWTLSQPYNVPVVRGDFTILSCIIHTGGHWQACVRHPGTGVWWRMLDSGVPQELGPNPAEIREATYTDPARQNTDGRYGSAPGARYEPMIWFYVRTKALADFTMKPGASSVRRSSRKMGQTPSSSQLSVRDFEDASPNDPLIQLFGRLTRQGVTRIFYADSQVVDSDVIIGAAQLLQHLDDEDVVQTMIQKYGAKTAVVAIPGWKTGDAGFDYVVGVNEFIHPLLVNLFTRKKIGDRLIPKEIHNWFREEAKAIYLGIYDEKSDSYFVPKWSRVRDVKRHVWSFQDPKEILPLLGKAWGNLLILLLMTLVGKLKPTDETFLEAKAQHDDFRGAFVYRLNFMAKQITLADALRWESRDDEVKYITSQLQHLDESDDLHDLRLQQLHDRIAVLEGRPTRSLHHMFFEEKKE